MLVVCERWVGDGDRLLHIDPSSSDLSSTSFSSWLGLLNCGSLLLAFTSASCPQLTSTPTDSSRLCPSYIFVWRPSGSAVLPLIYTGASLDWQLGQGSIYYTLLCSLSDWYPFERYDLYFDILNLCRKLINFQIENGLNKKNVEVLKV